MATYLIEKFQRSQFGYASAISVIIFTLSLVIALLYQRFALNRDLKGATA
jgi:raffinose/stachyose/melibiose transport system permease protein